MFLARQPASSITRFLDHTQPRTTVGRTPLDERSARHEDFYLKTHNILKEKSMIPVGFELTISAGEPPHTYALDRAAAGSKGLYIRQKKHDKGHHVPAVGEDQISG